MHVINLLVNISISNLSLRILSSLVSNAFRLILRTNNQSEHTVDCRLYSITDREKGIISTRYDDDLIYHVTFLNTKKEENEEAPFESFVSLPFFSFLHLTVDKRKTENRRHWTANVQTFQKTNHVKGWNWLQVITCCFLYTIRDRLKYRLCVTSNTKIQFSMEINRRREGRIRPCAIHSQLHRQRFTGTTVHERTRTHDTYNVYMQHVQPFRCVDGLSYCRIRATIFNIERVKVYYGLP